MSVATTMISAARPTTVRTDPPAYAAGSSGAVAAPAALRSGVAPAEAGMPTSFGEVAFNEVVVSSGFHRLHGEIFPYVAGNNNERDIQPGFVQEL